MDKMTIKEFTDKYGGSQQYIRRLVRNRSISQLAKRGIISHSFLGGTILLHLEKNKS